MINTRIGISLMSIVVALAMAGTATYAFFTDSETSTNNQFTTGTLNIDITDQNSTDPFVNEVLVSNWAPGEQTFVNFDVANNGTLPVNLRGSAGGNWSTPALDSENAVKVIDVERWNGAAWESLGGPYPGGIVGNFYYSPTGSDTALFQVDPGQKAQLRLTVVLDASADNDFQSETFTASLTVDAKQINASW